MADRICGRCGEAEEYLGEVAYPGIRAMICAACGRSFDDWLNRRPGYDG